SDLAFLQGDFEAAFRAAARSWATYNAEYPRYTRATYLFNLCRACFYCSDREGLLRWAEAIEGNTPVVEEDRIVILHGRLLGLRAAEARFEKIGEIAELSRSILRRLAAIEGDDEGPRLASLRGLAL